MRSARSAGERFGRKLAEKGPRAAGAVGIAAGVVLLGLSALVQHFMGIVLTVPTGVGGMVLPMGVWIVITGRTHQSPSNPVWWSPGYYLLGAGGLALALYVSFR